ncbi:hypothetical protein O9993_09850 [Vibrio lentus]|nr:hypothetical protein [Vibrio lentus]
MLAKFKDKAEKHSPTGSVWFSLLRAIQALYCLNVIKLAEADKLGKVDFQSLIFARQMLAVAVEIKDLPTDDSYLHSEALKERRFPTLW